VTLTSPAGGGPARTSARRRAAVVPALPPARVVRGPSRPRLQRALVPWLFLVPGLAFAAVFKLWPMLQGFRLSVLEVQPFLGDLFVGLDNYRAVLSDPRFVDALGHTVLLGVGTALGGLVVGTALALLLEGSSPVLAVTRTAVFLPVVTAVAVVGEIWRIIYFPTSTGLLNSVLGWVGIPAQQFLGDPQTALWWVVVVGVWTAAPYDMVIILAGLAGIDRSLYEAASVDGASVWQRLRHIVIPGLRASISVVLTLAAIRSLRTFTEVYVLTGGGPAGATEVWMTRVYSLGFRSNDLGLASAASVLLLVVTLVLTLAVRWATARRSAA